MHRALAPVEQKHLPSNFAYTTMRRIRLQQQENERWQNIVACVTIACVIASGLGVLGYLFGPVLLQSLVEAASQPHSFALVLPTLFCLTFFVLLNHWLSRRFGSREKHMNN